jgi:hypothetical protein
MSKITLKQLLNKFQINNLSSNDIVENFNIKILINQYKQLYKCYDVKYGISQFDENIYYIYIYYNDESYKVIKKFYYMNNKIICLKDINKYIIFKNHYIAFQKTIYTNGEMNNISKFKRIAYAFKHIWSINTNIMSNNNNNIQMEMIKNYEHIHIHLYKNKKTIEIFGKGTFIFNYEYYLNYIYIYKQSLENWCHTYNFYRIFLLFI